MNRRIFISVLLLISFFLTAFIIYSQIRIRRVGLDKQGTIEIKSDLSDFSVREDEIEKFAAILDQWGVFAENNFFLHSLDGPVTLKKIVFHLTDQKQDYQFVYEPDTGKVLKSVGEDWNEKSGVLDLYFHLDPVVLKEGEISVISKNFNNFILIILYTRTHPHDDDYIAQAGGYFDYFLRNNRFPFVLERK